MMDRRIVAAVAIVLAIVFGFTMFWLIEIVETYDVSGKVVNLTFYVGYSMVRFDNGETLRIEGKGLDMPSDIIENRTYVFHFGVRRCGEIVFLGYDEVE